MNALDTIKNNVTRGLVMDSKGNWVSIASLKAIEHNVLMHLEAGEVLYEGTWERIRNLKPSKSHSPRIGQSPEPRADHSTMLVNDVEHITNKKAIPWTVISLRTGEQHTAPESMIPIIRDIGPPEGVLDDSSNTWENATKSQLKIIALVSSAIIFLSLAVFIGIRLLF
jgi:hypothetical protein